MEVISDILTETLNGVSKTRIMYQANLNFSRVNQYLPELLEKGLITKKNNPKGGPVHYKTTEKGKDLLELLKKAQEFVAI
ncbi:MAG: winged helix-turn-helix domain-containing protein [Candidatus Bathyarchaeaceae archaeon]